MSTTRLPDGPRLFNGWGFIHRPRRYYRRLRHRFGGVVTLRPPRTPIVMVLSSEGARELFATDPAALGAFQMKAFSGLAGTASLWVLEGEAHRSERRLLSPPFHASCVHHYADVMQRAITRHTASWHPGQTIRAYDTMLAVSREIILRTVLGLDDGALLNEGHRVIDRMLRRVHPWIAFGQDFQSWWFPPWLRFKRSRRDFDAFVARCLEERGARPAPRGDLFGAMLAARSSDGSTMSDQAICDELRTILFSGHETTAVAVAWTLYELARHPAVLARLRAELEGIEAEPDAVVKQPYLNAVCDETLRLHTILTEVARTTLEPIDLLGYRIPSGTGVGVAICAIHQDPSIYEEPDRFRPERFLDRSYSAFQFLPFGGSHRRCLGAAFSDYEMRLVVAAVVRDWEFESARREHEVRHNIAMGPRYGVRLRVMSRRGLGATA